jgi:hypothetical protein
MVDVRDKTAEDTPALEKKLKPRRTRRYTKENRRISSCTFVSFVVDWSERRFPSAIFTGTKIESGASDGMEESS